MQSDYSLEEFRKLIRDQYSSKGIIPPAADSAEEKKLYEQWLKGKEKLEQLTQKHES